MFFEPIKVTVQGIGHLIQYIYTGRFQIKTENVISLAKAAKER